MAVTWTREQKQVIDLRNRNILVSAAAGSGKTAVLVERILTMITDKEHPIDIDNLLIVTFTRAAASEMKERIRMAIEKRLLEEPEDEHLQRQSTLIHNAQINTIDGFCTYVLRNYFHMIDLDPGYKTPEDGELRLLKQDVLKQVLEDAYDSGDSEFEDFVECYASGKSDENIGEQVLKLYEYSMSYPWPKEWLVDCKKAYAAESVQELLSSAWMEALLLETGKILEDVEGNLHQLIEVCRMADGPYMYEDALKQDLLLVQKIIDTTDYDERGALLSDLSYARLSGKKDPQVAPMSRTLVQDGRKEVKAALNELRDSFYSMNSKKVLEGMRRCRIPVNALIDLTITFADAFAAKKREKNLVDFSDMEHLALEILVKKEEDGLQYSQAALDLAERFEEIFIDEYQDSNMVQETILTAVSRMNRGIHNIFMVGDVKQSIYRFRLARPELFMEKFHTYSTEDSVTQRIDLHKNFRSRAEVLSGVNYIFRQIMGEDLGKVEYDDDAALYPGADFPEGNEEEFAATELLLIEKDSEGLEEERGMETVQEIEALAVAGRIHQIVGRKPVLDKETGKYRPCGYGDIVILLRTTSGWAETFGKVLADQGIPSYSASKTGYFSALEVVTVLNYLHILDNPRQDIPLGAVLHSPIGGFSAQELAEIRAFATEGDLYSSLHAYRYNGAREELRRKAAAFWEQYEMLRKIVPYTPIHELIQKLLEVTDYRLYASAMPGGEQREANLRMLVEKAMEFEQTSYRGLFNFIRYIRQLQKYDVDYGEVNLASGDDVVRIMSIHKSKGLEFPVVFASGLGKRFNQQDVNAGLVMHQELGIGADCIYPELRIKNPTVMKEVIRRQIKTENLGEELRVLYVAVTRAKEKLILTGTVDHLKERVSKCRRMMGQKGYKVPYAILAGGRSYLDWILPAVARHGAFGRLYDSFGIPWGRREGLFGEDPPLKIQVITALELISGEVKSQLETEITRQILENWDTGKVYREEIRDLLKERFSYEYPYEQEREIPVKMTVSELKKQGIDHEESYQMYFEPDVVPLIPAFIQEKEESFHGAARGTAYHRVLECLDLARVDSPEEIGGQIADLVKKGQLDEKMAKCVSVQELYDFASGLLGRRMAAADAAGRLYREQPFVISQKASDIQKGWGEENSVLVQGIIDVYFIEEGQIVLADYKTDHVSHPGELIKRYRVQLDYYARALKRLTGLPVKEKMIYSFALGEVITL